MQLNERAMLVTLNIAVWHAEREDSKRVKEIADKYGSDARMGKYRKYLVDPEPLKPILKKRGEMRNRHYELTLPWGNDSSRIITTAGFMRYRDEMTAFKDQLEPMFQTYCDDYPQHVAYAAQLLNGLYNPSEYPNQNQIRGYFRVGYRVRPVPDSGDFRANLGADEIATIRAQIQADTDAAINEAMRDTVQRIKNTIGHMAERLKAYKLDGNGVSNPFRDSLVGNVRDLVDILPGLNVSGDARINGLISEMKQSLTKYEPDTLRVNDVARENTAKAADVILDKLASYGL
jgi:hypothetical protein